MATMKDIARIAKVSTSTVSHVINNSRFVSDEIREKVLAVVEELNYTPSALARSLKVNETKTIGMLVTASDNPFFAEILRYVEQYCHLNNYNLILSYTDGNTDRLQKNIQALIQKKVDGLILMCAESHWNIDKSLNSQLTLPMVIMDWWPTELNADKIHENSELGGYIATKALIEKGYKDIAIITGGVKKSLSQNRLNGYKKMLVEANIPLRSEWIIESHFNYEDGFTAMQKLLEHKPYPRAVFACSDTIAIGAYKAIWQAGLKIPEDIAVIGYDDIHLAQYLSPPLTTIHQPKKSLAKTAVETLLDRIKNHHLTYKNIVLEPTLILRESI
ncbi:substrate-binding domain-containing protein [Pasteurella skyensis]|uniref:Ribose operon repressor n=1 Tax=Phocoenobacter skyensis TaxID=97481 RepID=A0AAJ6NBW8_9PAST|nr:substrate-binding domain-containing protein [Pasteurella skyensis]MDP8169803.1 substrate-binding domain-containing protein [Pasteurella skyensis]MDP8173977.1 substrate-binding domain-containing protein [Pasteurella skyensis]MDP8177406.1 substrate-binding domain-containing protein [Pasteurella skyensis]MDP8200002.1 substrate-binding domain-containing protein [Pasteurella skyensis]